MMNGKPLKIRNWEVQMTVSLQLYHLRHYSSCTLEESDITGWPVKKKQSKLAIKKMVNKYRVVPLPAFGLVGDKIRPGKYETVLKGADVQAHFTLLHWPIKDKRGASDTMVADVLNLRVYVPARLKPVAYAKAAKRSLEKDLFTPDISAKRSRTMGST